ncbi:MAG: SEL1-like repeat protein [Campylobacteraceae bacterium]|nr:SEL1-like repeat protein [Campylobacteraceae bacterium]
MAQAYESGESTAKDINKAKSYYKKACELGYKQACGRQ